MSVGRKSVVVVGGSFGGINAAYELRRRLPRDAEITVISRDTELAARVLRPGGVFIIGDLGKYSSWAVSRTVRGWFGARTWRRARFWSLPELQRMVVEAGLIFRSGRGAIYYPRLTSIAKLMSAQDEKLSKLGQFGAAFLVVRAEKPR